MTLEQLLERENRGQMIKNIVHQPKEFGLFFQELWRIVEGFSKWRTVSDLHFSKVTLIAMWEIECKEIISGRKHI